MARQSSIVSFLYGRAKVERQMGQNQLMCGNESGKMRLERADKYEEAAMMIETFENAALADSKDN